MSSITELRTPAEQVPAIDLHAATMIVGRCFHDPDIAVTQALPLSGGMINRVEEWQLTHTPHMVIAKMNHDAEYSAGLHQEQASLNWCRAQTRLPVPEVYGLVTLEIEGRSLTCLLMQRLPGRNLDAAKLSPSARDVLNRQLARHLAALHQIGGERYGHITEPGHANWIDWFLPRLQTNFVTARPQLASDEARIIERLLADLPDWLAGASPPSAVHGDIWGANLMVDDRVSDAPVISGFIDGAGLFADVDYELAYIRCFSVRGYEEFYRAYTEEYPLRPGYERRWRVYWINTILLHVWMFGGQYMPRCREVLHEIAEML